MKDTIQSTDGSFCCSANPDNGFRKLGGVCLSFFACSSRSFERSSPSVVCAAVIARTGLGDIETSRHGGCPHVTPSHLWFGCKTLLVTSRRGVMRFWRRDSAGLADLAKWSWGDSGFRLNRRRQKPHSGFLGISLLKDFAFCGLQCFDFANHLI